MMKYSIKWRDTLRFEQMAEESFRRQSDSLDHCKQVKRSKNWSALSPKLRQNKLTIQKKSEVSKNGTPLVKTYIRWQHWDVAVIKNSVIWLFYIGYRLVQL